MKKSLMVVLAVLLALGGATLWAQEEPDGFALQLKYALMQAGWNEEQAGNLVRQQLQWKQGDGADAEAVALALAYAYGRSREQSGAQEQARLALQVALMLKEMEGLGLERRAAARTMLRAMRGVVAELPEGSAEPLGDQLQQRLQDQLRQQLRLAECDQSRQGVQQHDRDQVNKPDDLVPGGPGNGQHWGGSGGGQP